MNRTFLYQLLGIYALLMLLPGLSSQVMAQSSDQNYIQTAKVRTSGLTTEAAVNTAMGNKSNAQVTIQYLDGLGRPMQVVQRQGSPLGKDMIQPIAYDTLGREVKQYLPYVSGVSSGIYQPGALTDQQTFYNSPPTGVVGIVSGSGQVAYSETKFEASPLNRLQQQGFPGADWKIGGTHTRKQGYGFNAASDVRLWKITDTGAVGTGYFPKARLYTDTLTDENGNKNITYTDFEGKVLLKRVQDNSGYLSTYYVYDELSNLRYVLPPGFTATVFSESNAAFDRYIYAYHYNGKRQVVEKKIPARGWEFMVYNKLYQLVMSQTATQRAKSPQEWTIFKFDELGRPGISGIYVHAGSAANTSYRTVQQAAVDANSNLWETSILTGTGYTSNTYPTSWSTTLSINYYDNYNFPGGATYSYGAASTMTNGLLTGTKVNVLGTSNLLLSLNFYNNKGQLEKYFSQHYLGVTVSNGNYDEVSNTYLFSGELASSTRKHFAGGSQVVQIAMRYLYDHMGRKTKTYQQMDANTEVLLSEVAYNELGQVYTKSLHNGLQTTTFSYNSRGWLTGSSAPLFALQLKYNDGSIPRYNGDITEQKWGTPGSLGKSYTYSYDKLGRLTDGVSGTGNHEKEISYDVMGNILSLKRDAAVQNYTYTGNRLSSVSSGITRSYTYDSNGNALTDGTSTITYNFLDLPVTVISGGITTTYTYDATGNKLRKVTGLAVTEYIAGIQYAGSAIDFIQTEEGLVRKSGSNYLYQYDLKDHLGNSRLSFDIFNNAPREVQHDDYYPFGKAFNSWTFGQRNNYLYNGKELQGEWGRYDYGARFYDPLTGRWDVVDPMAENFDHVSPYNYGMNNPVLMTDPDGMDVDTSKKVLPLSPVKPIQLKEVVIKSGNHKGMVAYTVTPLFGEGSFIAYRLPEATRLAGQAAINSTFTTFTPLGRAISVVDNLLNLAHSMRMANKTIDDLKKGGKSEGHTGNGTEIINRDGGIQQADKDFDDIVEPGSERPNKSIPGGRIGKTQDGKTVNVRNKSLDGRPTLEVYNPNARKIETKFRY
ncbi:RHS repeat-associated core domain protein [Pedobacter cryoconitis]|uniref:RHS repeat-associated core domain protein n=1 Tax=Pedobacter cryoconitis TaxID=188932 RepID=A0A127VFI8_9SPHI|nr:DUF6443 domain-containing protein [Pedobacter cryoconitis]AMQ00084.1 RHS repeat-associated core domain protein [Pedobacter cryoconitis]